MKKIFFLSIIAVFFTSCISTKELTYLQPNTTSKSDSIRVAQEVSKPYRVQTNDILSINIKALDQKLVEMFSVSQTNGQTQASPQTLFFNGYTVDDHGNIRVPILGEVNVLGYTTDEVRQKIEKQLLEEYFRKEANIFVTVKLAGLRYTINGEIGSPGTNVLYQDRATIMEAIANSGDIPITGNRKEVQIIRKFAHGFETYSIDLTKESAMNSPYFYIQPNDYIIVKPLKQKTWGTGVTGVQSVATIMTAISLITTLLVLSKTL
ncbi:protein involved in gliding motility EpsA [Flavobacterium aquaticum]|jgi:polysaccharide export outer membrane protein|uniref:Protein involved in gliding motility EpsA n=1 Tax=Flavobacterium aquaticum TaxID=1236486 RepID=A0A327YSP0_9FLAO|nr:MULTISPECIES: polysaccharide biosynthesis/export family protein [Flavobacterium]MCK6609226.1 polysaccharide biosynthesis/export family protein [Flavobacterium sp.]RAK22725.1 protein involved in gliding motility EpsA [Flavobacterium aquaticum]